MRYFHKQQSHFWKPVINLDKVHFHSFFSCNEYFGEGCLGGVWWEDSEIRKTSSQSYLKRNYSIEEQLTNERKIIAVVTRPRRDP